MDPLVLPIIDLVIMSNNGSIITVIIGNNDLVIICNHDVITDVIMSLEMRVHHSAELNCFIYM